VRCIGRTPTLRRCKRNAVRLVCRDHRWQPVAWLLSLVTAVGFTAGLYQDLIKPLTKAASPGISVDPPTVEHSVAEHDPPHVQQALDDAERLLGVGGTVPSVPYSLMMNTREPTPDDLREALRRIEYVETLQPSNSKAEELKAIYLYRIGRPEQGAATLQQLAKGRMVTNPEYFYGEVGALLLKAGKLNEAAINLQRAITIAPNVSTFHNSLGVTYLEQRRDIDAEHEFREAVRLDNLLLSAQNGLSISLKHQRKYGEALKILREMVRKDPNSASAVFDLGVTLCESGDAAGAVPWLERATQLAPTRADMWESLAAAYEKLRRYGDAVNARKEAVRLEPGQIWHHIYLAIALSRVKDYGGARESIRVARTLHPEYMKAILEVLDKVERSSAAEGDNDTVDAVRILRKIAQ
jgi:Flp pilus assembly protein TadD